MIKETGPLTPHTTIASLLADYPQAAPVLLRHKMSCVGCDMATFETLEDAARIYRQDLDGLIRELSRAMTHPIEKPIPSQELIMDTPYTFFPEIAKTIDAIPEESIVSRTVFRGEDGLKAIVFAFAPGQELSEHTAAVPAMIQILEGECVLTLGEDRYEVKAGAWARMPANLKHSILAKTPVKMLLIML